MEDNIKSLKVFKKGSANRVVLGNTMPGRKTGTVRDHLGFQVAIRSHDLRFLLAHNAGVPRVLWDLPSLLEFLNGKWKEYVLEKAFWEVISIKRHLDQKYSVGSEYAHEWEETQRPEFPSTA